MENYETKAIDDNFVTCSNCPDNCEKCLSQAKCTKCKNLYFLNDDDKTCKLSKGLWVLFIFLVVLIVLVLVCLLIIYFLVTPIVDASLVAVICGCIGEIIGIAVR